MGLITSCGIVAEFRCECEMLSAEILREQMDTTVHAVSSSLMDLVDVREEGWACYPFS